MKYSEVQEGCEGYALQAVSYALENFKIDLDGSEESIQKLDSVLEYIHQQFLKDKTSDADVFLFAKAFGSYLGEVYRRHHEADWGIITNGGESFPGMKCYKSDVTFWPWGRVYNRIKEGEEDNVWHYYQILLHQSGSSTHLKEISLEQLKQLATGKISL